MYLLTRIGTVDVSQILYNPQIVPDRRRVPDTALTIGGTVFDVFRGRQTPHGAASWRIVAQMVGNNIAEIDANHDALMRLDGTVQTVYRKRFLTGQEHDAQARVRVTGGRRDWYHYTHEPVIVEFTLLGRGQWYGITHTTTATASSSPTTVYLPNVGNDAYNDAVITITAAGGNITALTLAIGDADYDYGGTVTSGQSLVIDAGALTVLNNGSSDVANWTAGGANATRHWLPIAAGGDTLTITYTGGSGHAVSVSHRDAWRPE